MTCWTGIKTALVTPKKRREPSWIISGNPLKDPPPSLPEMEVVGDSHQTVDHTRLGLIRSTRDRNSTCNTLYWDFVLNQIKGGRCSVVVSWKRFYDVIYADVVKQEISIVIQDEREQPVKWLSVWEKVKKSRGVLPLFSQFFHAFPKQRACSQARTRVWFNLRNVKLAKPKTLHPGTHIPSDMCSPTRKHISLVICVPLPGNTYPQ